MSHPDPLIPFSVDNTLGALFVGGLCASAFWGVTSLQTYIYYQRYPNDQLALKLVVAALWVLDTLDACLTSHSVYHYLVTNFMNPEAMSIPVWSLIIHESVTTVTDVVVRCMFSTRLWGMSNGNITLTSVVWIISLVDLIIGLVITVKAFQLTSMAQIDVLAPLFYSSFLTSFAGDLYVAIALCYYLFRSRTGIQSTDTLLKTLIAYVITTGLLTSIDAFLGTIFFATMRTNYIFIAFYFNLEKLYINSYLAMLNARQNLCKVSNPVSVQLSRLSGDPQFASAITASSTEHFTPDMLSKPMHRDLEIAVHTTVDRI